MRVLSGIQPSGKLHLGNYFGAMRQHIGLQEEGHECFYFIANYHALTSLSDPEQVRSLTQEVALGYLALGLDPARTIFFRQSDVPEVAELTWILSCVTPMGLLQRCHSYKDKVAEGLSPSHGLFAYPVLQAADILIYRSQVVPVGQDQKQHLEVTQDIQAKFNQLYGDVLIRPEPLIVPEVAVVPGIDGKKMSKSYDNTIELFGDLKAAKRRIMSIKTDSAAVEDPKDPDASSLYALLKLMVSPDEAEEWAQRYRKGGMGYGRVKQRMFEAFAEIFGSARQRYTKLSKQPDYVEDVLREGGRRAREVAREVMADVRAACGIVAAG